MDTIQMLYSQLDETLKNSYQGRETETILNNYSKSKIGEHAPEFLLIDMSQQDCELSSLKGKYILLDFWASWCAPCIEDFPKLKDISLNFGNGLEVIGISIDENTEKWRNAIQKYDLSLWKQLSLKENQNFELQNLYFVNAIPTKVLIDPDGIIIGRWRGGGIENLNELENLIKQSLKY